MQNNKTPQFDNVYTSAETYAIINALMYDVDRPRLQVHVVVSHPNPLH